MKKIQIILVDKILCKSLICKLLICVYVYKNVDNLYNNKFL